MKENWRKLIHIYAIKMIVSYWCLYSGMKRIQVMASSLSARYITQNVYEVFMFFLLFFYKFSMIFDISAISDDFCDSFEVSLSFFRQLRMIIT